jgi:hypothetical protein
MSKQQQEATTNKPIHAVRHRNLKASIWVNRTEKGLMYNVTVTRAYRENDGWHDSTSFGYDDLMNVAKLMCDAHSFISAQRAKEAAARQPPQTPERAQARPLAPRRSSSPSNAGKESTHELDQLPRASREARRAGSADALPHSDQR